MKVLFVSIINELYSHPFRVMLTSIIENNIHFNCDFVCLYDGKILTSTIDNVNKIYNNVNFIKVKNEFIKYDNYLTRRQEQWIGKKYSVFSRFEIFDFEEYDKLIYLDVDTVIDKNLDFLIKDCNDSECYAVKQNPNDKHFNAGVMVINKKTNFLEYKNRCFDEIEKKLKFIGNQPIFNECFKNSVSYISNIYNLDAMYENAEKILRNNEQVILHFPGEKKPWDKDAQFSSWYSNSPEFNKKEFLNIWNKYEKIYNDKYKNL